VTLRALFASFRLSSSLSLIRMHLSFAYIERSFDENLLHLRHKL
jgi:hypothetical protein